MCLYWCIGNIRRTSASWVTFFFSHVRDNNNNNMRSRRSFPGDYDSVTFFVCVFHAYINGFLGWKPRGGYRILFVVFGNVSAGRFLHPPSSIGRLIWSSSWLHKRKKRCSEFKYLMQQKRMKARKKYECQRSELHNVKHTHCEEEEKKNTPKTWSHWKCWTWSWFSTEKTQGASWNTPQRSARDAVTFFPSMHNSKNSNSSWLFCFYAQVLVSECNFLKYYTYTYTKSIIKN